MNTHCVLVSNVNSGIGFLGPFPKGMRIRSLHITLASNVESDVSAAFYMNFFGSAPNGNIPDGDGSQLVKSQNTLQPRIHKGYVELPLNVEIADRPFLGLQLANIAPATGPWNCIVGVEIDTFRRL